MALNKEKASYITKNIAELINTQDISLLHDASELLRILKNKGDQRFVDIVNNIESKLNNNQTWTLAKQFPNVAEQGLQALRDWSAKADMQRERMAILQYYAEERENRDAREARNANLARNVVGGMGVSLGSANSFNSFGSFGSGLYFDNNINTMMVRLSFLDREMRLDEITHDFINKEFMDGAGRLNQKARDNLTEVYNVMSTAVELDKPQIGAINAAVWRQAGANAEIGEDGKVTLKGPIGEGVFENASKKRTDLGLNGDNLDKPKGKPLEQVRNQATNNERMGNSSANTVNSISDKEKFIQQVMGSGDKVSREEALEVYRSHVEYYKKDWEYAKNTEEWKGKTEDDYINHCIGKSEPVTQFNANQDKDLSKDSNDNAEKAQNLGVNISQENNDLNNEVIKAAALKNLADNENFESFRKFLGTVNSREELEVKLEKLGIGKGSDDFKRIVNHFNMADSEKMGKLYGNSVLEVVHKYVNDMGHGRCSLTTEEEKLLNEYNLGFTSSKDLSQQDSNNQKQKDEPVKNISSFIANTKTSKASKAEPIQELAPENKGKPDSQASLVSSIASVKKTPTFQMKKTKEEQDENIKKETESYFADKVEPNRTADHSPRALNEKNTTASIEEQKIILAQQERNMTQEEKMRMEQENASQMNTKKSVEV
ncbi:hypothetical protein HT667_09275 [Ursidibacter maritimus]|uniref:hypothetical protein n=1 Tax=Ursidibacter maritimus TaxID=1331689 RepID=UPI001C4397E6|nr:hypothetical protein [Ursidibacter maritimus]MBV6541644.1 hypothetical protein [Ursidibacter maritimus]